MSDKNVKTEETFEELHDKPIHQLTRRELLGTGLINFSAAFTLPPLLSILAQHNVAQAQDIVCAKGGNPSLVPFIHIDLAGGAALSANFVPQDEGLQPLKSYTLMGMGRTPNLRYAFANNAPFFASGNQSGILLSLETELTGTGVFENTVFSGVCVRTRDDSSQNPYNMTGMLTKAGRNGFILPDLGANRNNQAFVSPGVPLTVGSFNDVVGAISVNGSLGRLSKTQQEKLFKTISNLSSSQGKSLASFSGGEQMQKLIKCATESNAEVVVNGADNVDPVNNADVANVWGINANTSKSSRDYVFATMVYNTALNNTASATLSLGGYDYHNNTRSSGDQRDAAAGIVIARVLRTLAVLQKKAFVIVTTDGAVNCPSDENTGVWSSDRGAAGCLYMMAYDPLKPPSASSYQLGHFNAGQAADTTSAIGGTPERAIAGIFANYLNFCGQLGQLESVAPRTFSQQELEKVLIISG